MNDYAECAKLGVATISEAAGPGGLMDIPLRQPVPRGRAAGPARTVHCGQDDNLMVHAAIERIVRGEIVVLAMPEPRVVALVGGSLATQMLAAGAAGPLCDAAAAPQPKPPTTNAADVHSPCDGIRSATPSLMCAKIAGQAVKRHYSRTPVQRSCAFR